MQAIESQVATTDMLKIPTVKITITMLMRMYCHYID